jgi:hypothetical protein
MTGNGERLRDNMHEFMYHRRVLILKRQIAVERTTGSQFYG